MYKQYLTIKIQATCAAFVKHTLHAAQFYALQYYSAKYCVNNGKYYVCL